MATNNATNVATGTSGTILQGAGVGTAPVFSTATYPATATTGDLLYASGTNAIGKLAIGATNQVPVVTSGVPAYSDCYGRRVLLGAKQTASNSSSIIFTSFVSSAYSSYFVRISNVLPATNTRKLLMTVSTDNGSTYLNSNYLWTKSYSNSGGSGGGGSNSDTSFQFSDSTSSTLMGNYEIELLNLNDASNFPSYLSRFVGFDNNSNVLQFVGVGTFAASHNVNAIKFAYDSGNITSGVFSLYGVIEA